MLRYSNSLTFLKQALLLFLYLLPADLYFLFCSFSNLYSLPWEDPTEESPKLEYNAAWLTGSAVTQEYHVMIQEGLEYSYLTNGLTLVLLRVPCDEPSTQYYHCEPNMEINLDNDCSFEQPLTAIAQVSCLCLMSFGARPRVQA